MTDTVFQKQKDGSFHAIIMPNDINLFIVGLELISAHGNEIQKKRSDEILGELYSKSGIEYKTSFEKEYLGKIKESFV